MKIAAEVQAEMPAQIQDAPARRPFSGPRAALAERILSQGDGWQVRDVLCNSGPHDRPFEERHECYEIALVLAGTFQYRAASECALMTPGSLLLGRAGDAFECGHEHGTGDRCLAFQYSPEFFESIVATGGSRHARRAFRSLRLPPLREMSPVVARAVSRITASKNSSIPAASAPAWRDSQAAWEEIAFALAGKTLETLAGFSPAPNGAPPSAYARLTRTVRMIESEMKNTPASAPSNPAALSLRALAREAGLSPYHFLRTFEHLTGLTPHQYIRRARLRQAAARLASSKSRILDVAFDSGFNDISNFNHAFRSEFGASPRAFRQTTA